MTKSRHKVRTPAACQNRPRGGLPIPEPSEAGAPQWVAGPGGSLPSRKAAGKGASHKGDTVLTCPSDLPHTAPRRAPVHADETSFMRDLPQCSRHKGIAPGKTIPRKPFEVPLPLFLSVHARFSLCLSSRYFCSRLERAAGLPPGPSQSSACPEKKARPCGTAARWSEGSTTRINNTRGSTIPSV